MKITSMRIPKVSGWRWSARKIIFISAGVLLLLLFWLSLPSPLFRDPYTTVVYDRQGGLLGARIAADGQWRFPERDSIPEKFRHCLLQFEDRHFYRHPGVNPGSLVRALRQNIMAGKIVSGGSTLTMQTIRLARKGKPRTVAEKCIEMWLALRLEAGSSKNAILGLYASHAPFGGNVVGLDAASWRYYGRPPEELSWAEAALLAVLPNAPSAMHPGRNRDLLLAKRNKLLERMHEAGIIDGITCRLASEEPLPLHPLPLPNSVRHLVEYLHRIKAGEQYHTTIDAVLQARVIEAARRHQRTLDANRVFNAAVIVISLQTREVLAYVGNTADPARPVHSPEVDLIHAPRSTGSILKPFLYAAMMDAGELLPGMLVPDIPSHFSGFSPKNFSLAYDGAVPASQALSRSLNVPAVYLMKQYGVQPFYDLLKKLGMRTLARPSSHYGLSLILGGAETTLWDISAMYMNLARTTEVYASNYGDYRGVQEGGIKLLFRGTPSRAIGMESLLNGMESLSSSPPSYSAAAAWLTMQAMLDVNRPEEEEGWRSFASSRLVAWKTGTSFGFRDAWAIGMTGDYLVGVWAGNATGEGRPGLTGVTAASPLMFEVFRLLPSTGRLFPEPYDELLTVPVCRQSGYRASVYCPETDSIAICLPGTNSPSCPYHKLIHLDETENFRVHAGCYSPEKIITRPWFLLPPSWAAYYRMRNPLYHELPPWLPGCSGDETRPMQFIYPVANQKVFIPTGIDGKPGEIVFEAAHQAPSKTIYWHLNDEYAGFTKDIHKMSLQPPAGVNAITLVDEEGNRETVQIEVK